MESLYIAMTSSGAKLDAACFFAGVVHEQNRTIKNKNIVLP